MLLAQDDALSSKRLMIHNSGSQPSVLIRITLLLVEDAGWDLRLALTNSVSLPLGRDQENH